MPQRLWEYRGYWLRRLGNSPNIYACWYDQRSGRECRRSLATQILDVAKDQLIALVGSASVDGSRSPERVMILAALDHYFENDVKAKPSSVQARRAITVVNSFLDDRLVPHAPVSAFGPLRQREFMTWSHAKFNHGPSTIARNLSVVSSAFRFGCRLQLVTDGFDRRHEVQLLDSAPAVETQANQVAKLLDLPDPKPREWWPSYQQFGAFIDAIGPRQENLFRYVILALNTWARPEAIIDLRVKGQVDFERRLIDLNPPGRRQTRKYRPRLRLTQNLADWLRHWGRDSPLEWDDQSIGVIKKTFKRQALACGFTQFTQGTIRHFMATEVRALNTVSTEQRDIWLGHRDQRTAIFYESFDPEFLSACCKATEKVIAQLQKHTKRALFARKLHASAGASTMHTKLARAQKAPKSGVRMVGVTGIEPVTPTMSTKREIPISV